MKLNQTADTLKNFLNENGLKIGVSGGEQYEGALQ